MEVTININEDDANEKIKESLEEGLLKKSEIERKVILGIIKNMDKEEIYNIFDDEINK